MYWLFGAKQKANMHNGIRRGFIFTFTARVPARNHVVKSTNNIHIDKIAIFIKRTES